MTDKPTWADHENWKREEDLRQLVGTLRRQVEFLRVQNETLCRRLQKVADLSFGPPIIVDKLAEQDGDGKE